jgi:5-methylcytosine-specific restriction endonuclease McrA
MSEDTPTKTCTRCKAEKPETLEFFRPQPRGKNGLESQCRECRRADRKEWYARNAERRAEASRAWYHSNKERATKTHSKYYKENFDAIAESNRQWKLRNKDIVTESNRRYAHRRRARIAKAGFEFYTEQQVLDIYGTDCYICSEPINLSAPRSAVADGWKRGLHIDHVIPIALGGSDIIENVRPSHAICNLRKSSSDGSHFL